MRNIIILFMLQGIVCSSLQAQPTLRKQINNAQFQIAKATVEFLTKDSVTFKKVKSKTCSGCKGFKQLDSFANANDLKGVPALLQKWKNVSPDTADTKWESDLEKYKKDILATISEGEKKSRQNIPGYNEYKNKLNAIIQDITPPPPPVEFSDNETENSAPPTDKSTKNNSEEKKPAPLKTHMQKDEVPAGSVKAIGFKEALPYIIMALVGLLYFQYRRTGKKINTLTLQVKLNENTINNLTANLQKQKNRHEDELKEANGQIEKLGENLQAERKRNQQLTQQISIQQPQAITENKAEDTANTSPRTEPPPRAPVSQYARYADQGNGFSVPDLLKEEDNETIFEIIVTSSNTATFKITNNISAQKLALANASFFLNKTCRYDTAPSVNSNIITDSPGELTLQGNKWVIVNPAKISFS